MTARGIWRSSTSKGPMKIIVLDEEWRPVGIALCAFALKIAITNLTDGSINLAQCSLQSDPRATNVRNLTVVPNKIWYAGMDAIAWMERKHEAESLSAPGPVPALTTVSGWLATWGIMQPSEPGRPACLFVAVDHLGNRYELAIHARPPRRFRSR